MTSFAMNEIRIYVREVLQTVFGGFFLIFSLQLFIPAFGQTKEPLKDSVFLAECAQKVKSLIPIFTGEVLIEEEVEGFEDSTQRSTYPYSIHAIKHEANWIMLVVDMSGFYSYTQWPDSDSLLENTPFVNYTLCEIISREHFEPAENKKKEKFRVGDLEFVDYYVLKKEGKKLWEQVILMEYNHKDKWSFFKNVLKVGKLKEVKQTVADQQKSLDVKAQEIKNLEEKLKNAESDLEILKSQLEKCEQPGDNSNNSDSVVVKADSSNIQKETQTQKDSLRVDQPKDKEQVSKESHLNPIDSLSKKSGVTQSSQDTATSKTNQSTQVERPIEKTLLFIEHQMDSLVSLIEITQEESTRNYLIKARDSLDKAYAEGLILLKEKLNSQLYDSERFSTPSTNSEPVSAQFEALQKREDSLLYALNQYEEQLNQTESADIRQYLFKQIDLLIKEREAILDERKRILNTSSIR